MVPDFVGRLTAGVAPDFWPLLVPGVACAISGDASESAGLSGARVWILLKKARLVRLAAGFPPLLLGASLGTSLSGSDSGSDSGSSSLLWLWLWLWSSSEGGGKLSSEPRLSVEARDEARSRLPDTSDPSSCWPLCSFVESCFSGGAGVADCEDVAIVAVVVVGGGGGGLAARGAGG